MSAGVVRTSREHTDVHTVTRWHASVEWSVPAGDGSVYTGWISCQHDHMDMDAAAKCRGRLAHRIRNNPHLFPDVQRAINDAIRDARYRP